LKKGIQDLEFCFQATIATTSSPPKSNNESNNKKLYKKKLEKNWTMWKYTREAKLYRKRR
jgi:hypothetical protein